MSYKYRVEPFMSNAKGRLGGTDFSKAAALLQAMIDRIAGEGWEFVAIQQINTEVGAGCLGSLMGQSGGIVPLDMVIFRRAI